jgi:hypothetical protein
MNEDNKVTFVITSCGRFDLLEHTIKTFKKYNKYPIEKFVIIDNSCKFEYQDVIKSFFNKDDNVVIIFNETNIGQVNSIDKVYQNYVDTEYIFHCEDDWEFYNEGFISRSLEIMKENKKISNINIRTRFSGDRGSMHPIENNLYVTKDCQVGYYLYETNYLNEYHGFSWNPGLRRLSDYKTHIGNYKQYVNEQGANQRYFELGFRAACLEESYCRHSGINSTTPLSNC